MAIKLAIVGTGSFAQAFIPLYQRHPLVGELALADLDAGKLSEAARKYGVARTFSSLAAVCESDFDAVVLLTQHWLHGPQAVAALRAGKAVYSAVPAAKSIAEMRELVKAVEQTGGVYMMGETSYYYPEAIYCRGRFAKGGFGHIVYGEGEYYHDWDHGLYEVMRMRAGENWRKTEGAQPPMWYPTHSTSFVISTTGAHATHVSCQGFVDTKPEDRDLYDPAGKYHNTFSNEMALFRMSDGSAMRINEFRRIGHYEVERMTLFGTEGSFEHNEAGFVWVTKDGKPPLERLDELLTCGGPLGFAPIHPVDRLPAAFRDGHAGYSHMGSHAFLVDDFVTACANHSRPPIDVWQAARYLVPGLIAHESALAGGKLLEVPDWGSS
ncbi:MAG TPA: Gfo/Idh/MocA family oxidoreductase [Tepidisphaeraceae bacterium]|jgi:predicted dehydrogenase